MESFITKTEFREDSLIWKGSQLRCLLLSGLAPDQLQYVLTNIIEQKNQGSIKIEFTNEFEYFPKGPTCPKEVELDKAHIRINGSTDYCKKLQDWWLDKYARTPVWDFVCTATIDDIPGLILVEAKAHQNELVKKKDSSGAKAGSVNRIKIESALSKVNTKYSYQLSTHSYFQLSNRIAWSLKLASLGIPVVLIYLGCIDTKDMAISKQDSLVTGAKQWDDLVTKYSDKVSFRDWEKKISGKQLQDDSFLVKPSFFYPIIRTANIHLQRGEIKLNCSMEY